MRPTVKLQEGVFITDFPGYNLLVQSVNGRTNEMRGVTIYQFNPGAPPTTILAARGYLSYRPDGRTAVLELKDGEIHEIPSEEGGSRKYRRLEFKTHTLYIPGAGGVLERTIRDSRSDREMSARALIEERGRLRRQYDEALTAQTERLRQLSVPEPGSPEHQPPSLTPLDRLAGLWAKLMGFEDPLFQWTSDNPRVRSEMEMWRMERESLRKRIAGLSVEIHKKFSLPAAAVVFVLIGAPIGMRVRRAGPGVAFVSVAFFLFYYLCLVGGEELANRLLFPPWLSMWLPNLVLGLWGLDRTLQACEIHPRQRARRRLPATA
jgi:lipopolysaccharide export system permease protein